VVVFAISWSVALSGLAAWTVLAWLRRPSRDAGLRALGMVALAVAVVALTGWWLAI
jgi:hypothetical protein